MDSVKSLIKFGVVTAIILLLLATAFILGYEVGNGSGNGNGNRLEKQAVQTQPTATVAPTSTPIGLVTAVPDALEVTDTSVPIDVTSSPSTPSPSPEPTSPATPEPVRAESSQLTEEATLTDDEALGVLQEVWDLLNSEFFGELPPPEERVYGAIRGMLETLDDDYTSFSEPAIAEIRRSDDSGTFEGIGALVRMNEEDILEIVQPFDGSPAEEAGLLPGDLVLAVDGESIVGYGIFEAITLIRGPEGTAVTLTIQRGDAEPFETRIVRAPIEIPVLESQMLEGSIGYVRLFDFSSPATSRIEDAIQDLLEQDAAALILDLRGNPGGFLDQAVQVSDLFLDEGLVLIERRSDGKEIEYTSTDEGPAQDIALVVLINGASASASEIVAGAIQDRDRGVLIGETSFGKGSVQLVHALSDGSELRVTVARFFTPSDRVIHGEGLTPDIEVPLTPEDHEAARDPQLERAIEYLRTNR